MPEKRLTTVAAGPRRPVARYLLITDHDNERFTVEGPIGEDRPWIASISVARRSGHRIDFRFIPGEKAKFVGIWSTENGYELWPAESIVRL